MHIPDSMLQGAICPVTAVVSGVAIVVAVYCGMTGNKPSASRFAAITTLIFAVQMVNFPILNGISGHLLGGVLAASLLATPFAILSVTLVVVIQSLVFSDGGVTVLGANLLNMAVIGTGTGGLLRSTLLNRWQSPQGAVMATAVAAWVSVVLSSFAVCVELILDGQIAFSALFAAMLGTHALIGIGEALLTVGVFWLLPSMSTEKSQRNYVAILLTAATMIALLLSPFASGFPDGLEWVAEKYQLLHEPVPTFVGLLPDYSVSFIGNKMLSTGVSGLIGTIISFAAAWAFHRIISLFIAQRQIL